MPFYFYFYCNVFYISNIFRIKFIKQFKNNYAKLVDIWLLTTRKRCNLLCVFVIEIVWGISPRQKSLEIKIFFVSRNAYDFYVSFARTFITDKRKKCIWKCIFRRLSLIFLTQKQLNWDHSDFINFKLITVSNVFA